MFTGLITATAKITLHTKLSEGLKLNIETPKGWDDLLLGESIAVNGACLTVSEIHEREWSMMLMPETLQKTSFGRSLPKKVNLERAMIMGERLGGHIVQGHVDGIGTVSSIDTSNGYRIYVTFPEQFQDLVIDKGSITIDGVSLTVVSCSVNVLSVALIPHTLKTTTLKDLEVGDTVNLEFDIIGKYILKKNLS